MKTIKMILAFLLILFYLFLNYSPLLFEFLLDKELDNGGSVSTLAKEVSKNASCSLDIVGSLVETGKEDIRHELSCNNKYKDIHFSIYIFKTQTEKNKFLAENKKRKVYFQKNFGSYYNPTHARNSTRGQPEFYNPCFKHGKYYVVCENANWNHNTGVPQFNGEPYYHEFTGNDIDWEIPLEKKK